MQEVFHSRPVMKRTERPTLDKTEMELRGYEEVKNLFTQQDTHIKDSYGNRWIMCEQCSLIKPSHKFAYYGGPGKANSGTCSECIRTKK